MSINDNKKLIKKLLPTLIYNSGHLFAQLDTSFTNTLKILEHQKLSWSVTNDDIKTVLSLNKALKYILNYKGRISLNLYHILNQIVAYDALDPGYFAYQPMRVNGVKWQPPMPSKKRANQFIKHFTNLHTSYAIRAIELMLQFDRYQFFWDGNKRTAWLVSNYYLMKHGVGVINIKVSQAKTWNKLLLNFYNTGDFKSITVWLLKNCLVTSLKNEK